MEKLKPAIPESLKCMVDQNPTTGAPPTRRAVQCPSPLPSKINALHGVFQLNKLLLVILVTPHRRVTSANPP
ncbi:hypothetical protein TorRG33x02_118070 [Trema orientale]|uniref:Uncharacterized protein n=1 Tax=Trema orientale TaxID=63057 RepID=A0A2P5F3W0_TREOI|nr:hypothetical protein TorRG33x02_118070 [Trema orientale]